MHKIEIRKLSASDSLQELTALVRRAYQRLADLGFSYQGTRQNLQITKERIAKGDCFVALHEGVIIGTILMSDTPGELAPAWYERNDVATFHQFAVDPAFQSQGVGRMLLDFIEARAKKQGFSELACDTSEGAHHLIEMYRKSGYRQVGTNDWPDTNYLSVVLSKAL